MGKIKLRGYAKRNFTADLMEVTVCVSTDGETAAYAIKKGKKESEKILKLLAELGVDLSKVNMRNEQVSDPDRYRNDESYSFEKTISFMSRANLGLLEKLSLGITEAEIDATYRERFCLSNADDVRKQVLQEALADSRKKAEAVAETLGQKVVGIETAQCDEYRDDEDEEDAVAYKLFPNSIDDDEEGAGLSAQLAPGRIVVDKSIDVSWIVE